MLDRQGKFVKSQLWLVYFPRTNRFYSFSLLLLLPQFSLPLRIPNSPPGQNLGAVWSAAARGRSARGLSRGDGAHAAAPRSHRAARRSGPVNE